jgi:protein-tyrosine-phosphatase
MNILFVCTANKDRSRTAELYFQNKYPLHRFRSTGINKFLSERHGGIHIKRYMLEIADLVICMEKCHSDYIIEKIDKGPLIK